MQTGDEPLADLAERVRAKSRLTEIPFEYEYDTWVLHPDSMRFLVALTRELRPQTVVEFGSGLSTRALAHELPTSRILSFDHSSVYSRRTRDAIGAATAGVDVLHRPMGLRFFHGKLLAFYRVRAPDLATALRADLVLVDGPPGSWGREAALYASFHAMRVGALLLLDDAGRPGERAAAAAWHRRYGDAIESHFLADLGKGMLVVRKRGGQPCGRPFTCAERRDAVRGAARATWRHRPHWMQVRRP